MVDKHYESVQNKRKKVENGSSGLISASTNQKIVSSIVSLQNQKLSNFNNTVLGSGYNESRLSSMSHIKQIAPRYKNYVIPLLPGVFNKFSNI